MPPSAPPLVEVSTTEIAGRLVRALAGLSISSDHDRARSRALRTNTCPPLQVRPRMGRAPDGRPPEHPRVPDARGRDRPRPGVRHRVPCTRPACASSCSRLAAATTRRAGALLDLGTGSGVLAIAAEHARIPAGARPSTTTRGVTAAEHNAAANDVRYSVRRSTCARDHCPPDPTPAPVITPNLLRAACSRAGQRDSGIPSAPACRRAARRRARRDLRVFRAATRTARAAAARERGLGCRCGSPPTAELRRRGAQARERPSGRSGAASLSSSGRGARCRPTIERNIRSIATLRPSSRRIASRAHRERSAIVTRT